MINGVKWHQNLRRAWVCFFSLCATGLISAGCSNSELISKPVTLSPIKPLTFDYTVSGSLTKVVTINVENASPYAGLSLYADGVLLLDNFNIPEEGATDISALVRFPDVGLSELEFRSSDADLRLIEVAFKDAAEIDIPVFEDVSAAAGLENVASLKYGGPTIADMDMDGDYEFIINNHNDADTKLYWNNGDGTATAHSKNLSRWFMHDLHGTAAGDYDNDGDLDLVVTQGGGNGANPSTANFYQNNDGTLVLMTGDVGITKGGRGRGARWMDPDLDGDLDLFLFNEEGLKKEKPQHFFYENQGDSTFTFKNVNGLQDIHASRILVTDINGDNIDDIIAFSPLSVWQGNGDFTFTDVTSHIPEDVAQLNNIMAIADIDIDNDGDFDLYLARGKEFEFGKGETPSMDFDPIKKEFSIKPRGFAGIDKFDFTAEGAIKFHNYYYLAQGKFRGQDYPIYLGQAKTPHILASGEELTIVPEQSEGWPQDISTNGVYFGHLGGGKWKAALVRNGDVFWGFKFTLSGVTDVTQEFVPQNRNEADILLRNDTGSFVDVSKIWKIVPGVNSLGVTVGDFNNASHQDLLVYRWGKIANRISDYMLLNTGQGHFETVTMHGASDVTAPGNGDMGQAFDFDMDGDIDLLSGAERGEWNLYRNFDSGSGNFALVRVGYSPRSNIDPISAEVTIKTKRGSYNKRVGSAGEIFSQSLLNTVHFGLGQETQIEEIKVKWRNGENVIFNDKTSNQIFDTDKVDPLSLSFISPASDLREGTSLEMAVKVSPPNANPLVLWSSSDESVISVTNEGVVTAKGQIGESAIITAKSAANDLETSQALSIKKFEPVLIKTLSLGAIRSTLTVGETFQIDAIVAPTLADNSNLIWRSSNSEVAKVSSEGRVTAESEGEVIITAVSEANPKISQSISFEIAPFIEGFIEIEGADLIKNSNLVVGDSITMHVNYHAGTGNKVIASDEGGMRFWLRHFKSEWIPAKDYILTDKSVLGTTSGHSTMTLSLEDLTPTEELPPGHFYYLRASFAASDGTTHNAGIYPLSIIADK